MKSVGRTPRRAEQLVILAMLGAGLVAQVVGAVVPGVTLLVAGTAAGIAADLYMHWRHSDLARALTRVRADVTVRQLLRDLLLITGLLSLDPADSATFYLPLFYGLLVFYGLHFASQAAGVLVKRTRTMPFVTRNIDVSALRPSPAAAALLTRHPGSRLLLFGLPATVGLLATALSDTAYYAGVGIGLAIAFALAGVVEMATKLLPSRRPVQTEQALAWLDGWLADYKPTVGLYFSGGRSSAYQANMWLSTLEQLEGRPIIIVRERFMVQKLGATDLPIVCIPRVAHLMRLEQTPLRVLLHPANSGKTSQILRIPTIKHAFINHGESDKLSSCNPYAKAYDEVWVAGPAARQRYDLADIGVEDKDVVEVGRPQLAKIQPAKGPAPRDGFTTVLYAPTWEGWTEDPGNTSIILAGENIVRGLLADPNVRLLYKPHPMTGSVDPRAGAADRRIVEMIEEANRERIAALPGRTNARPAPAESDRLRELTAELDRLTTVDFRPAADELERMGIQSTPEPGRAKAVAAATTAWEDAYWAGLPDWEHQVITGDRPALYSCFNEAHLLISDVSSVVSDWLASEKPYAVVNTSGLTEAEFRVGFPTVRAATILAAGAEGVPALLDSVRESGRDELAEDRVALRGHLLGPSDPPSIVTFNRAVQDLAAKAEAREARLAVATASEIPLQRVQEMAGEEAEVAAGEDVDAMDEAVREEGTANA